MTSLQRLIQYQPQTSIIQTTFRWLLGLALLNAGISHLTVARVEFLAQVPRWVPIDHDFVVVASGIAEIALGAALIVLPRYRVLIGWITAAFFIVIFPGNIWQFIDRIDAFGMNSDAARAVRLLFQPVLIAWALWSTGAWQAWRNRHHPSSSAQ